MSVFPLTLLAGHRYNSAAATAQPVITRQVHEVHAIIYY